MLSNPGAMEGLAYIQARRMGVDPITAMSHLQQMRTQRERTALYRDEMERRKEEEERKEAERRKSEQMMQYVADHGTYDLGTGAQSRAARLLASGIPLDVVKALEPQGLVTPDGRKAIGVPQRGNDGKLYQAIQNPDGNIVLEQYRSPDNPSIGFYDPLKVVTQEGVSGLVNPRTAEVQGLPGTDPRWREEAARVREQEVLEEYKKKEAGAYGAADAQAVIDAPKDIARAEQAQTSQANVVDLIDEAISQADFWTTGYTGSKLAKVEGTNAYDLAQTVKTIKSNLGFDRLQQMREASKTGGALGQVAIQELEALQNSLRSLDTAQSKGQVIKNLQAVKLHYTNLMEKMNEIELGKRMLLETRPKYSERFNETSINADRFLNVEGPEDFTRMSDEELQRILRGE